MCAAEESTSDAGAAAMTRLLERAPDIDAVFAASDVMAVGAIAALRRAGRRVPEDVAVIGYDDTPDSPFTIPSLSTIAPDKLTLAATALDLLAERIQGYDGPPRTIDTPYSLVVRESTVAGAP